MDNEREVTLAQMQETRGALSEKLETLGHQVADTVQDASTAVHDTVENVRDAVHDTVENIKDTFDVRFQVKRHPWGMVAGSIALGYLGGYLLFRQGSDRPRANGQRQPAPPDRPRSAEQLDGDVQGRRFEVPTAGKQTVGEVSPGRSEPGWLSGVTDRFGPEITKLKGLALGTVLSVVRDVVIQSVSQQLKPKLADVMDSITLKLGGEPIPGPVLKDGSQGGPDPWQRYPRSQAGSVP